MAPRRVPAQLGGGAIAFAILLSLVLLVLLMSSQRRGGLMARGWPYSAGSVGGGGGSAVAFTKQPRAEANTSWQTGLAAVAPDPLLPFDGWRLPADGSGCQQFLWFTGTGGAEYAAEYVDYLKARVRPRNVSIIINKQQKASGAVCPCRCPTRALLTISLTYSALGRRPCCRPGSTLPACCRCWCRHRSQTS